MADRLVVRSLEAAPLRFADAVVVIGGPSRVGHRRVCRLVEVAAEAGLALVVIDAFDGWGDGRGPGDVVSGLSGSLSVEWVMADAALRARLQGTVLWRLADRLAGWRGTRRGRVGRVVGAVAVNARRVVRLGRGVLLWRCVRAQLDESSGRPAAIVHTDDFSVTSAWHLARRFRDVPAENDVPPSLLAASAVS